MSIMQYDTVNKTVYRRSSVHKHSTYKLPEIQTILFICPVACETVNGNSDRRCTIITEKEVGIIKHFERRENDKHCTHQLSDPGAAFEGGKWGDRTRPRS